MTFQNLSIRTKLTGMMTLISGITLLLATLTFTVTNYFSEQQKLRKDVQIQTRIIALNSRAALVFDDPDTASSILRALEPATSIDKATLFSEDKIIFAEYHRNPNDTSHAQVTLMDKGETVRFESDWLIIQEEILLGEEVVGYLVIQANLYALQDEIGWSVLLGTGVLSVALLIALILTFWFQRIISGPIESLRMASIEVGKGRFDTTIEVDSEDEIGQLAKTFRKMVSDLADQRTKLEQATRAKSEFLANMSHEIRTPMNAVIGLSDLALQGDISSQQRDYLTKISNSSRSLLRIINDILDFSKIEAGKLELESTDFYLREVFEHLSDLFRAQTAKKHLELILCVSDECRYELYGDSLRLEQVLLNLIGNAVKFTDEGEIEVQVATVEESSDQVVLQFSVRDTGIGLSPEHAAKLFTAFSQADNSTTRKFGGTGLGLSISQRLVEMMSGQIWVESQTGQGSTFYFTTTFNRRLGGEEHDMIPPDEMEHLRALVVDDNQSSRQALSRMLTLFSFISVEAASGPEALTAIHLAAEEGKPFQLVLVDWLMPDMDGIETIRKINNEIPNGNKIKTVLLTSFDQEESYGLEGAEVGVDGFVGKPVNCSLLFDTIMDIFGMDVAKAFRIRQDDVDPTEVIKQIGGARVLLVEDNAINRQVACEILYGIGLQVEVAEDGEVALEKVSQETYDVVLMDIQMPKMDGYEATRLMRSDEQLAMLPIIAMTAHAMTGDYEKSLEVGMNDHVPKPIDKKKLYAALIKWVRPREGLGFSKVEEESQPDVGRVVPEEMQQLSGLDVQEALDRLNGNDRLYYSLLSEFYRDYAGAAEQIGTLFDEGEKSVAVASLIHTIKGMAGNISANELAKQALALEKGLDDSPDRQRELFNLFGQALEQVMDSIARLKQHKEKVEQEKIRSVEGAIEEEAGWDAGEVSSLVLLLSAQLGGQEIASEESFQRLRSLLLPASEEVQTLVAQLGEQIDRFDFAEAQKSLTKISATLALETGEQKS
ncbi:MAG: response regulator [Magnetococcales bacterium]|nr:response regulator [Magnetococcales bacterium]